MMASGAQQSLMMGNRYAGEGFPDYLRYIFSHPIQCEPGTKHHYSNGDTYLCGRMVEKAVGKTLIAYLYEKIFQPMGMRYPTWEMDPYGHSFGASGLYMTIGDMIKLGQLYLAKGNWQGKQLVDSAWIDAAGACQINTAGEQNIWTCGYGYQFWKLGFPDAYRADGAYGQITAILPAKGLTVSIQCAESGDFGLTQPAFIKLLAEI